MTKPRIFTLNFIRMFAANIFLTSGFYMIMPTLPIYAERDLSIDKDLIGLIVGIFVISGVIGRPIAGVMLDKIGRMIIYIPSAIFFAFCFGLYIFSFTFFLLLLVRFIHGFSWGFLSTSTNTVVSDIVPKEVRGEGLGYFGLAMAFAMAVGPAIGTILLDKGYSFFTIFILCMVIALIALFISSGVKPPYIEKNNQSVSLKNMFEKRAAGISLVMFFFGFSYGSVMAYPIIYGIEIGLTEGVKWFFLVLAFSVLISRPIAGKVMDKYGPTIILISGFIIFFAGLNLLGFSSNNFIFLLSAFFNGIGIGFIMPTLIAMSINVVKPSRRGAVNATIYTAFDSGIGIGTVILGIISKPLGYSYMYVISALMLFIPFLWYSLIERKRYLLMVKENM